MHEPSAERNEMLVRDTEGGRDVLGPLHIILFSSSRVMITPDIAWQLQISSSDRYELFKLIPRPKSIEPQCSKAMIRSRSVESWNVLRVETRSDDVYAF